MSLWHRQDYGDGCHLQKRLCPWLKQCFLQFILSKMTLAGGKRKKMGEKKPEEKGKMQPAIVSSFYLLISLWIWLFSCKKLMPFAVPWTILHLVFQEIGGVSSLNKKGERQVQRWNSNIYIYAHIEQTKTYKTPTMQLLVMFCGFQVNH